MAIYNLSTPARLKRIPNEVWGVDSLKETNIRQKNGIYANYMF